MIIATVTLAKRLPDRYELRATARLEHLDGNQRPYFSVTGELRNLRRRGDNQVEAAGQLVEDIHRHFPALRPLLALHLADDDGTPMYAVQNGLYWLGRTDWGVRSFDAFARLWRVTLERAQEIDQQIADALGRGIPAAETLRALAAAEAPRWQQEAIEGRELIERLAATESGS